MLNKATIIGRLGRDPEVRAFQNGGKVCNLSIATTEKWRDKASGERKERTEWHRVAIFNENLADVAEKYMKKGTLAYIEGQIETRKWTDQQGVEKYSTEIVLRQFRGDIKILADGVRSDGSDADESDMRGGTSSTRDQQAPPRGNGTGNGGRRPPLDDDIPF